MRRSKESDEIIQALFSMEDENASPAAEEALLARAGVATDALSEARAAYSRTCPSSITTGWSGSGQGCLPGDGRSTSSVGVEGSSS